MRLATRRTIRRWYLDAPEGTFYALLIASVAVLALGVIVDAGAVAIAGMVGGLSLFWLRGMWTTDACSNCRAEINALKQRYCSCCGYRLDDVEAAPPIDERIPERRRPIELNELERSPPVETIADGGEFADTEGHR
ncbi:zinc ribbon domain-containing protein [Halorubrum sp. F4]|uniref:zinc ribbon domain-containing protein n=1 Tax=Halorubrum sp. F4 TaxID=2989715 RepID=UPI0024816D8C|nr:zinc ribbon domain-containing protein [Halorubrum sp. F4]